MHSKTIQYKYSVGERAHLTIESEDVEIEGIQFKINHVGIMEEVLYDCVGDSGRRYLVLQRHLRKAKYLSKEQMLRITKNNRGI